MIWGIKTLEKSDVGNFLKVGFNFGFGVDKLIFEDGGQDLSLGWLLKIRCSFSCWHEMIKG